VTQGRRAAKITATALNSEGDMTMNALTANDYAGLSTDLQDYEKVTITDRGVVFRTSEDELIWMEVEGACDVLIDDAPLPQDEGPVELLRRHRKPARRPRGSPGFDGPVIALRFT